MASNYPPCVYRVSAKAVIMIDGKVLLVKEDTQEWELPGGGIEHHEEIEDALHREVLEETGLTLSHVERDKMQPWITYHNAKDRAVLILVYPATTNGHVERDMYGEVELRLFSKAELTSASLVQPIEKFREQLIQLAFPSE